MATEAKVLDWDSEISDDGSGGGFVPLEDGDYEFKVTGFERKEYSGSTKIPACKMAALTFEVETPAGTAKIFENLYLCSTQEWKLSAFFRSIGQKKHGEPLVPNWGQVMGAVGKAHCRAESYTNKDGEIKNKNVVAKYIDYDPDEFMATSDSPEDIPFN